MQHTPPAFKVDAFHCPLCSTFAHMEWFTLGAEGYQTLYYEAKCSKCKEKSLWRVTDFENILYGRHDNSAEMLYPDNGFAALPEADMPSDVLRDYKEAARIFGRSPRGGAALLRLALQKLCRHLGEPGTNINTDIRSLAGKNIFSPLLINVADTVRITGNNAVHPGEMSEEDFDQVASKMFDLLNFIVRNAITQPKELQRLYGLTPEGPRKDAEARDDKSRSPKH